MSLLVDATLAGSIYIMAQNGAPPETTSGIIIGAAIGTLITPDFDLVGTTYTERLLRRIPIVGFLLQATWYPYALLSKHRGLSHVHVLGTLTRFAYMLLALTAWTWFVNGALLSFGVDTVQHMAAAIIAYCAANTRFTIAMLLAWTTHDEAHLYLDGGRKRKRRK